jgi:nucleotide-binding universal stress UspA family protein
MKIMLPVDGSAQALEAVAHAVMLARQGLRASFVVVNVQEPASLYEMVVVHDDEAIARLRLAAGADLLAPAEALLDAAGLSYESEAAGGDPHQLLVDLAENYGCAAIVMGASGTGGSGMGDAAPGAFGSVAMAVLRHSPVPVTVVRLPQASEGSDTADAADVEAPFDAA